MLHRTGGSDTGHRAERSATGRGSLQLFLLYGMGCVGGRSIELCMGPMAARSFKFVDIEFGLCLLSRCLDRSWNRDLAPDWVLARFGTSLESRTGDRPELNFCLHQFGWGNENSEPAR